MTHVDAARGSRQRSRRGESKEWHSPAARFFSVFTELQTLLNLVYLLLAFPLGIAYFVILVTAISTSAGLLITIVGAPLFILAVYGWCLLGDLEGLLTNALLGTRIGFSRFAGEAGRTFGWARTKARLSNPATWRTLVFISLRFPLGIAAFVTTVTFLATSLGLITAPVTANFGGGFTFVTWDVDRWWKGLAFLPAGVVLLPISLHILNLEARGCGRFAEACLGTAGRADEQGNSVVAEAVNWTGVSLSRPQTTAATRIQAVQVRIFFISLGACLAVCAPMLVINALTTPETWWSLWVVWGASIVVGTHAGYFLRGLIGAHAGLLVSVNAGLAAIDFRFSPAHWFYWPLLGWAILFALHLFLETRYRRGQPLIPALLPPAISDGGQVDGGRSSFVVAEIPPAVSVDVAMRTVRVHGVPMDLTPKEFDLISLFVQNPGRPFSRDELLDRIWKSEYEITDRTIDSHVLRLRKKLGEEAELIQTVWGVGYKYGSEK